MDTMELATIGARIDVPEAAAFRSAAERDGQRQAGQGPTGGDRLGELAGWWATVAGTAPPRRVEQLWLPRASSVGPARAEVVIRRFDAPDDVSDALNWGVAVADDAVDDGTDLVLLSIQDDAGWPVAAAHLLGVGAVEALGWPEAGGPGDGDWMTRVARIRDGLRELRPIGEEPAAVLEQLRSPALAAGTGLLLQAAARRTPAVLDGPGAATCALLADRISPAGRSWWQAADAGTGPLPERILSELRLTPLTRLGLMSEDGTAARIALGLLETAIARALESADDLTGE